MRSLSRSVVSYIQQLTYMQSSWNSDECGCIALKLRAFQLLIFKDFSLLYSNLTVIISWSMRVPLAKETRCSEALSVSVHSWIQKYSSMKYKIEAVWLYGKFMHLLEKRRNQDDPRT
eukprot:5042476-Amphidinium_carterae.1